jgi:hypothetical protein
VSAFAKNVEALIRVYRAGLLLPNAQAVDTSRDVVSNGRGGHGKHGTTTTTPTFGADAPLPVELERSLGRFVEVWERRLEAHTSAVDGDLSRPGAKTGAVKRAEDDAILRAVGLEPIDLAFVYRRSTEAVRKLRLRNGLDPETGERVPAPRPITASPRTQLQTFIESRNPTTQETPE